MWIQRDFEAIFATQPTQPVAIVVGPRQSGKSSVLERLADPTRRHVTLDDYVAREQAQENPRFFLDALGPKILLDEAQYAPALFPELKLRVDAVKRAQRAGTASVEPSYWLTGSNRILLDEKVAESLAGRASYFRFHPLSAREVAAAFGRPSFAQVIERGGWPELWANAGMSHTQYLDDYLSTTLEKDVVRSAGIEKVEAFLRVTRLLAGRSGGLLSASEIARDAQVHSSTVSDWRSVLERMMYITAVPPFLQSRSQRLIKAPKIYFNDVALAARLQGWAHAQPVLNSPAIGGLFEGLVASEIVKTRDTHRKVWELTHFRTKEGEEVDFIVSGARRHVAIECKTSSSQLKGTRLPKSLHKDAIDAFVGVSFDEPSEFATSPSEIQLCSVFQLGATLLRLLEE